MCKKCEEKLIAEAASVEVDFNNHAENVKALIMEHEQSTVESKLDLIHFVNKVKSLPKKERVYMAAKQMQAMYIFYQNAKEQKTNPLGELLGQLKDLLKPE